MHNLDNMQWMETFYAHSTKLTRKKKQILKVLAQLDKSFSKFFKCFSEPLNELYSDRNSQDKISKPQDSNSV